MGLLAKLKSLLTEAVESYDLMSTEKDRLHKIDLSEYQARVREEKAARFDRAEK